MVLLLLRPCIKTFVIKKISQIANESIYDLSFPCAVTLDDYSKTTGYGMTRVPHCIDPICDLNVGHKPVARKRSNLACKQISDCVTVLVKTKHRLENVVNFIKSLHNFYPSTTVIVADEIDDTFKNSNIPKDWLKLDDNSIIYFQVSNHYDKYKHMDTLGGHHEISSGGLGRIMK